MTNLLTILQGLFVSCELRLGIRWPRQERTALWSWINLRLAYHLGHCGRGDGENALVFPSSVHRALNRLHPGARCGDFQPCVLPSDLETSGSKSPPSRMRVHRGLARSDSGLGLGCARAPASIFVYKPGLSQHIHFLQLFIPRTPAPHSFLISPTTHFLAAASPFSSCF